jgi:hypothetical protein
VPRVSPSRPLRRAASATAGLAACLAFAVAGAACSRDDRQAGGGAAQPLASRARAQRAFYYWRTVFRLSAAERAALRDLAVSRLYVRVFDVVWQGGQAVNVGELRASAAAGVPGAEDDATAATAAAGVPADLEIVPVVFVREAVLRHTLLTEVPALAARLGRDVQARLAALGVSAHELQLDCDWTDSSQAAFFALLRELRRQTGLRLSATLRLHQIKYRERTGVPPVERGMLMFYNMGRFSADPDERAIFDAASASRYLSRVAEYPLPLDVALPIWSWTLHLRGDRVLDVLQSTDPAELATEPALERVADERYRARATGFFRGALLRQGDELKAEIIDPARAKQAAALIAPALSVAAPEAPRTLALFDLSERNLSRHGNRSLEQLFSFVR